MYVCIYEFNIRCNDRHLPNRIVLLYCFVQTEDNFQCVTQSSIQNTLYAKTYRADLFPIVRCPLRTLLIKCVRKVLCPGRINGRKTLYKFNCI